MKVGINGFGRIGRCLLRQVYESSMKKISIEIVNINDIEISSENAAYLLSQDSLYGSFPGKIESKNGFLIVNENKIPFSRNKKHDWEKTNPETIVINTSPFKLSLKNRTIIYTDNYKNCDATFIFGFNHKNYDPLKHHVISAGTCTGNALASIIDIIDKTYVIKNAHFISVHPPLSDQKVIDSPHEKYSLGRRSYDTIITTESGIENSIIILFPHLKGKVTGIHHRVPVRGSLIDVSFTLNQNITLEEINLLLREVSQNSNGVIGYFEGLFGQAKVSSDFVKDSHSVIISSLHTQVRDNKLSLVLYHDPEWSYVSNLLRLLNYIGEIKNG